MTNATKPKKKKQESLKVVLWIVAALFLTIVVIDIFVQTTE